MKKQRKHKFLSLLGQYFIFSKKKVINSNSVKSFKCSYVDPENPEKVSEKSDIYSFGVVLLELISGRAIRHQGINIVTWVRL